MKYEIGDLVLSKAGRDKASFLIVVGVLDDKMVFLADGKSRKIEKPKLKKIKHICKDEFNNPYPTDGKHFEVLKGLFSKRDRIVHQKSKPYNIEKRPLDYDNMAEQYDDYLHAYETEIGFIYERLEDEMKVYEELKENLTRCSGREEIIKLLLEKNEKEIAKTIANSIKGDVQ